MSHAFLKLSIIFIILFIIPFSLRAQGFEWARGFGGSDNDGVQSVAVDLSGNTYVAGDFHSPTITLGTITLTNNGNYNIFFAKYDSNGNVIWAKSVGGTGTDQAMSIGVDPSGNFYLTGYFGSPSITFGTTTLTNAGLNDIYLAKFDSDGNVLWAKGIGGTGSEGGISLAFDAAGKVYLTGSFSSPSITFGTITLTIVGGSNFLAKYDSNGNVEWVKTVENAAPRNLAVDVSGNIYITGSFTGSTVVFGTIVLTAIGNYDIFLAKYDSNGNVIWAKSAGGTGFDHGISLAVDGSGNVYITGDFGYPSIAFDTFTLNCTGGSDIYLTKYDSNGNVIWAKSAGDISDEYVGLVTIDASNNASMIGWFNSATITFGTTILTSAGASDVFITEYNPNGDVLNAMSVGGSGYDYGRSIAFDANDNLYITGPFRSPTITFGTTTLTNTVAGLSDIFLAKFNPVLSDVNENEVLPKEFSLSQNYPNPFNPSTKIDYTLPSSAFVKLSIYSVTGELVKNLVNEKKDAGFYSVDFNAYTLPSGIYFYKLQTDNTTLTRKMIYLK